MVKCQNCGAHVSQRFVAVFTRRDEAAPQGCPECSVWTGDGFRPPRR